MMVIVHSVSCVVAASQLQLHSSRSNGQQPIETSHVERGIGLAEPLYDLVCTRFAAVVLGLAQQQEDVP
jgi:hypothetical protein